MQSYRGVSCARCRAPIPVCPTIVSLQTERDYHQTGVSFTFIARCRLCEQENIYSMDDVKQFEGEPRKRLSRTRAATA